jgi:Na+-driven multidrug efflux pump
MIFLKIVSPFYLVASVKLISDGILRGAGMMKHFMVATFIDLALRVVLAYLLSKTHLGSTGIWLSWPIGWFISMALSVLFYRSAKWSRHTSQQNIQASIN